MMTLYSYDHCPYCVKARMIFGFKNIDFHLETLLNDDEKTPISMIGQKMLPILKKESGEFMPESLDIIAYVDGLKQFGEPIVGPTKNNPFISKWLKDIRNYHYALAMPRWIHLGLKEFSTPSAQEYFTRKKELFTGPFSECLKRTPMLVNQAHEHLKILNDWMTASPYLWGEDLSLDDFHLFSSLRCLTTVENFQFPDKVNDYFLWISQNSKVPPHEPYLKGAKS